MSLELIEATLKEQAEALATAQRCHGQMTRLIKEFAQQHHKATHYTTQPKGQSKRQKQDTTTTPAGQAAPSRLDHHVVASCEDTHSDDDLIQALQEHERRRGPPQHGASLQLLPVQTTALAQAAQCNALDPADQQHYNATTQDTGQFPVLPVAGLRAFHFCAAKHRDGSNRCLKLQTYSLTARNYHSCSPHQFGQDILVEFWLAGIQHFCITPVPSATTYQDAARQLGAATHLAEFTATRLAQTTASSTAMRYGAPANSELIVGSNNAWSLSSDLARQAIAQLTWEEMVLAYNSAR